MMKKLLITAALALAPVAAVAADLPKRAVAPAPVLAVAPSWTGFYVSGSVGASLAKFDMHDKDCWYCASGSFTNTNVEFGGRVGFDYQSGPVVYGASLGIESGSKVSENVWWDDAHLKYNLNSVVGLRGRVGYAAGNTLLYASVGYLYGNVDGVLNYESNNNGANPTDQAKLKNGQHGLGFGVGFTHRFAGSNFAVGVEAEHQMFTTKYSNMYDIVNDEYDIGEIGFGLTRTVVRGTASYRF